MTPGNASILAWHGWQLTVPNRWNPVKVEGDFEKGYLLLADLHRPRLGIRWNRISRRQDADKWAATAMKREVGEKMAAKAVKVDLGEGFSASLLSLEDSPPGRDVWVGYSPASGRGIEVVYQTRRRERVMREIILPHLRDTPLDEPVGWSIFGLSCMTPAGMKLASHKLNAGDLTLRFLRDRHEAVVRQVSLAKVALARQPLETWLAVQQRTRRKQYKPAGPVEAVKIAAVGRELEGVCQKLKKRRRLLLALKMPSVLHTLALHDADRDRLAMIQGDDRVLLETITQTLGWAAEYNGQSEPEDLE
jgi:hypothetical protein